MIVDATFDWPAWDDQHGDTARKQNWDLRLVQNTLHLVPHELRSHPNMPDHYAVWQHVIEHWAAPECRAALELMAKHNPGKFHAMTTAGYRPKTAPDWFEVLMVTTELRL